VQPRFTSEPSSLDAFVTAAREELSPVATSLVAATSHSPSGTVVASIAEHLAPTARSQVHGSCASFVFRRPRRRLARAQAVCRIAAQHLHTVASRRQHLRAPCITSCRFDGTGLCLRATLPRPAAPTSARTPRAATPYLLLGSVVYQPVS